MRSFFSCWRRRFISKIVCLSGITDIFLWKPKTKTVTNTQGSETLIIAKGHLYFGVTYRDGSKHSRLTEPFFRRSYPTIVLECPSCCRMIGMRSVTTMGVAPRNASPIVVCTWRFGDGVPILLPFG